MPMFAALGEAVSALVDVVGDIKTVATVGKDVTDAAKTATAAGEMSKGAAALRVGMEVAPHVAKGLKDAHSLHDATLKVFGKDNGSNDGSPAGKDDYSAALDGFTKELAASTKQNPAPEHEELKPLPIDTPKAGSTESPGDMGYLDIGATHSSGSMKI